MPVEEVWRKNKNERWRGLHSGKEYQDWEVDEQCQGVAFGAHYGTWSDDFSEEETAAKPGDGGLVSDVKNPPSPVVGRKK